jgi:hypothetical protein
MPNLLRKYWFSVKTTATRRDPTAFCVLKARAVVDEKAGEFNGQWIGGYAAKPWH